MPSVARNLQQPAKPYMAPTGVFDLSPDVEAALDEGLPPESLRSSAVGKMAGRPVAKVIAHPPSLPARSNTHAVPLYSYSAG